MKCLLWKCWILVVALVLLMALGAFAEGTIGLASAAACTLGAVLLMRWSWAMEQRAERQAARHRRREKLVPRNACVRSSAPSSPSLRAAS